MTPQPLLLLSVLATGTLTSFQLQFMYALNQRLTVPGFKLSAQAPQFPRYMAGVQQLQIPSF